MEPRDTTLNIYQRMHAVMGRITYIEKTQIDSGDGRYEAVLSEEVVRALRSAMLAVGLVIYPVDMKRHREDERLDGITNHMTEVDMVYRIQNIDDPNDFVEVVSSGAGVDIQDKGVGKAMTYAYKYMAIQSFALARGNDPDRIGSDAYSRDLAAKAASGEYPTGKKKTKITFEPVRGTAETSEPLEL